MSDARALAETDDELRAAGLTASLLVRDLADGRELALRADEAWPLASLAKLPIALAVLDAVELGELDGARAVRLPAEPPGPGTGTGRFRHAAEIAVDDLVELSLTVSDNRATDALLEIVGLDAVAATLARVGVEEVAVRHPLRRLEDTPLERFPADERDLAHTLAIRGSRPASGHPVPQLDTARTSSGTARGIATLLEAVTDGTRVAPRVRDRMLSALRAGLTRHRLAPDLATDRTSWAGKTGTLLNLRHEAGLLVPDGGAPLVVVALSASATPASTQPAAEAALGAAARALVERVRGRPRSPAP